MDIVEIRRLSKVYPAFSLSDVSFSLKEGRIAGLIGRNGAGKSTTVKSMLNLIRPDGGEIRYFGKDFHENEGEIKQRIGYSTGSVNWYPRKRIRDIAAVVSRFYDTWDGDAYRRYLRFFGLDEEKNALQLSEGMKVKCNLLFALSHRARVLILDEPTSGLDPFSRDELLEVFRTLKQDGVTLLYSTHIISDIEKCADDILYLSGGRLAAALPKEDFSARFSMPGEGLEDTFLRLERRNLRD